MPIQLKVRFTTHLNKLSPENGMSTLTISSFSSWFTMKPQTFLSKLRTRLFTIHIRMKSIFYKLCWCPHRAPKRSYMIFISRKVMFALRSRWHRNYICIIMSYKLTMLRDLLSLNQIQINFQRHARIRSKSGHLASIIMQKFLMQKEIQMI